MTDVGIAAAATFAAVGFGLLTAHIVADHWFQSSSQAANKGLPGWPGRKACAAHVATYTLTTAAVVGFLWVTFGLAISPWGFIAGQLASAATHYWADRRTTLAWLCDLLGKGTFYRLGMPREVVATNQAGAKIVLRNDADCGPGCCGDVVGWDNPSLGTGAYVLDQAWHWGWLFVAAWVTAKM